MAKGETALIEIGSRSDDILEGVLSNAQKSTSKANKIEYRGILYKLKIYEIPNLSLYLFSSREAL